MADMTIAEFIRLRPGPDDDPANVSRRTFVCELPDVEGERSETWLDCGRIVASATHGRLRLVDIELNEVFVGQFDNGHYDPEEVLGVIVLWVGWESKWVPMDKVRIRLRDASQTLECVYVSATDRVSCGTGIP